MSEWKSIFERNRVIPPHSQTTRQAQGSSQGLRLVFKQVDGLHIKQSEESHALRYQLRVTLFDSGHQHFFGRTWKSGSHSVSGTLGQTGRVLFNEAVYFHTSLCLSSVVALVELVSLSPRTDGSQNAVGSGFGLLQLFIGHIGNNISQGEGRLSLFNGTPRALLHPTLKDPLQLNAVLSVMEGSQLLYSIQPHPALTPIMHLLPPNILVSGHDSIPGVVPPTDGTDALRKPHLLKSFSCVFEGMRVALFPSVEVFESNLLQLLNRDCQNTNRGVEGRSVVVQERRLVVGVHNGWGWAEKPHVLVLEHEAGRSGTARAHGAITGGSFKHTSTDKLSEGLSLRGSVELKIMRHAAVSIVFQLQYVFSCPLAGDGQMTSTAVPRAAFMQCIRWCVWSLFLDPEGPCENVCLNMQGGALPNPWGVMVYSANTQQINLGKSAIKFKFSSSVEGASSSTTLQVNPREMLPAKKFLSASQDESIVELKASTLQSTRGPALSLSQLTATSRYPTMSHTVGSPWQQQLPSLLSPSLMASAHQLSHVERPGTGGIAHMELSVQERDGERSEEEGEMQELAFNPVHAPVITLGTHAASSCRSTSRRSLAQLFSSGFPQILDHQNQVAEVLDPSEPVNFDPQREEADPFQANTLILQFLAFTRVPQAGVNSDWPNSVHFTFQLYRFPPVTTECLKLLDPERNSKIKSNPDYPCVLSLINKDGTLSSGFPGLQLQYRVDPQFLKPGERVWFLRYLALHCLQIDVWDSESLMLIGSAAVELKHMLRQGRAAVQVSHELEVITTEYLQDANFTSRHNSKRGAIPAINVYTTVKGILHLRLGNVGGSVSSTQSSLTLPAAHSHVVQPSDAPQGFAGGSVSAFTVLKLNASIARRAQRLPEIDSELARLLQSTMREVGGAILHKQGETDEVHQRKIDRMAAVRQLEERKTPPPFQDNTNITRHKAERVQYSRDLRVIEAYRERSKAREITNMLSQAITTSHTLYATLGTTEFFEFVLKNPFNIAQTVTIECDNSELSVIVKTEEWRYFKELTKTLTPLEEEMFHLKEGTLTPQVYLRPKESIHIPFKFQTFICGHTLPPQGTKSLKISRSPQMAEKHLSNTIQAKSIKVQFRGEDGKPLAICQVNVEPMPHVVDQTFRFYQPELTFLKKAIRLPSAWDSTADGSATLHVRCSDPNVICHTTTLPPGEPQDVYLKVPGRPSPQIRKFFITIFTDPWLTSPAQIWQVYVHYLQRMDLSCVCGTLSWQSLVLHGTQAIRRVKCYASHPLELQVDPSEVFALPAQGVQDVRVGVRALRPGSRFFYLNVVDVDIRQLVASWLLCITCRQPVISKAFEIKVPVDGGRGSNKKINFTNPYSSSRVFKLHTDHPDLLQFKEERFQIGGGEIYTIGLRFAPSQNPGTEEILVFINDHQDKNEDTYCVSVQYR
ncbi:nephrocystin-4-like [Myxocyprinus asiaticus]|uniref:nephrocystin-4-like n=1 Tax=Myxocyprinus asiaticus TaxID=70543 RepID=UPI0022214CD5|nr:nephrocystin-4-like [Myxocyprinus asiaticus]